MTEQCKQFVAYIRVSTPFQFTHQTYANQAPIIERHVASVDGELLVVYFEAVSTSAKRRPALESALEFAADRSATLIVATVDRLTRSLGEFELILESKVPLIIATLPTAPKAVLQVLVAVAEEERRMIGDRLKEGMARRKAEARAAGKELKIGFANLPKKELKRLYDMAYQAKEASFAPRRQRLIRHIEGVIARGFTSKGAIADELERMNVEPIINAVWNQNTVGRYIRNYGIKFPK